MCPATSARNPGATLSGVHAPNQPLVESWWFPFSSSCCAWLQLSSPARSSQPRPHPSLASLPLRVAPHHQGSFVKHDSGRVALLLRPPGHFPVHLELQPILTGVIQRRLRLTQTASDTPRPPPRVLPALLTTVPLRALAPATPAWASLPLDFRPRGRPLLCIQSTETGPRLGGAAPS